MTLNLTIQKTAHTDFTPRITVIGVGGGGTNAVNNMIALNLPGVDFIVANTDAQQLLLSKAERRIQLGPHITQGNGAGGRPEVGRASAEEAADDLARHLDEAHMVFITAGMGGGTGTGAAPVIARMARERGILTVGVVTKPFAFEGKRRMKAAEEGIADLQNFVDTLIVIPNQNLFKVANERTGWKEAFQMADHVLYMGVRGVTDLMVVPGLVNLDYADIRSVMAEMGKAMMGTGEADGDERSLRAAEAAISNPLLEDTNMKGARGLLINITGGSDLTLFEVDQAANRIREEVDEDANIMFGTAIDEELNGRIRISVVATGIDTAAAAQIERPRLVAVGGGQAMAEAPAAAMAAQAAQQAAASAEVPSQPEIAAQTAQPQGGYPQHAQPHSGQPYSGQPHSGQPNPVQQLHPAQMPQQQPQPPAPQHHGAQSDPTQHGAVRAPISAQAPLYPREQPARPAEPAKRPSLFNRMTQGLRAAAQAQAPRTAQPAEPQMAAQAPSHNAAPVYPPQQQPQQAQPQHPQAHAQQAYPQHGQGQPMRAEQAPGGQSASGQAASGQMHFRGSHEEHRASVRQMQTEDIGLDIPAFLRRQHS